MERILNQDEIDELLAAFDEGEIDARLGAEATEEGKQSASAAASRPKHVTSIDLTKGQNYSKWRIANLDIVFNSFARYYSIALTNSLQQGATLTRGEVESRFFEDFLYSLQNPGVLGAFSLDPLKGSGLFVFDRNLCFGLVEVLFGMSAASDFVLPDREVTAIEANILRSLLSEACRVFNRAFAALDTITSSIYRVDTNPRMVNILAPDTEVIQVSFKVELAGLEGEILLVIPYFSLEPYKDKLRDGGLQLDEEKKENKWAGMLEKELKEMEIPVSAVWGELQLTIQEILSLEAGDIVGFDYDEDMPIEIVAGRKTKFRGQPGVRSGKKVVRVGKKEPIGD